MIYFFGVLAVNLKIIYGKRNHTLILLNYPTDFEKFKRSKANKK